MAFRLLDNQKSFYPKRLAALWGVYNNPPYSQHRNYAERQVQSVKRIIKQCTQGKPGVQEEPMERSQLETILAMSALALNNTPYLSEENTQLMAPVGLYAQLADPMGHSSCRGAMANSSVSTRTSR